MHNICFDLMCFHLYSSSISEFLTRWNEIWKKSSSQLCMLGKNRKMKPIVTSILFFLYTFSQKRMVTTVNKMKIPVQQPYHPSSWGSPTWYRRYWCCSSCCPRSSLLSRVDSSLLAENHKYFPFRRIFIWSKCTSFFTFLAKFRFPKKNDCRHELC